MNDMMEEKKKKSSEITHLGVLWGHSHGRRRSGGLLMTFWRQRRLEFIATLPLLPKNEVKTYSREF